MDSFKNKYFNENKYQNLAIKQKRIRMINKQNIFETDNNLKKINMFKDSTMTKCNENIFMNSFIKYFKENKYQNLAFQQKII